MPTAVRRSRSYVFFGNRFPAVVVWLAAFVLIGSCLLALDLRVGQKLLRHVVLQPEAVLHGQVWRLATWGFLEFDGLALVFGVLALLIFGRDLGEAWGPRRYLVTCAVVVVLSGAVTTLFALVFSSIRGAMYVTVWALVDALIIAWATLFPTRQMLVYFVLPLGGRNLVLATVGGTLVFAMLYGFSTFLPHFIAEGLMLAYMREPAIKRWFRGLTSGGGGRRKVSHLRAVDRLERDEDPPRWLH